MKLTKFTREQTQVNEGPLDFIRGAGAAAGRHASSAVGNAARSVAGGVRNIAQAGAAASTQGDLEKAVAKLAALLASINQQDANVEQQPQENQPRQSDQPKSGALGMGAPDAFRTTTKPRGQMGKHGFEYTFDSFLQATHGDQLDEGIWDFVKGAGQAAGKQLQSKIDSYASRPSVLKDIYASGLNAHQTSQRNAEAKSKAQVQQNIEQTAAHIKQIAAKTGPAALVAAIKKFGGNQTNAILKMVGQGDAPAPQPNATQQPPLVRRVRAGSPAQ